MTGATSRSAFRRASLAVAVAVVFAAASCTRSSSPLPSTEGGPNGITSASPPLGSSVPSILPPLIDVPEYRGNSARTGVYPGPGPIVKPELVWSRSASELEFSPILADGLLLVGASDGHLYALDARTGTERWRYPAIGTLGTVTGFASAADGTVVISISGGLHGIDLSTGMERWAAPGRAGVNTDIVDGIVYSAANDGHAYGLDLQTGDEVWSWAAPAAATYITVDGGTAYVSVADGDLRSSGSHLREGASAGSGYHQSAGAAVVGRDEVFVSARGDQGETDVLIETASEVWKYRPPSGQGMSLGAIGDLVVFYSGVSADGPAPFPIAALTLRGMSSRSGVSGRRVIVKNAELVSGIRTPRCRSRQRIAVDVPTGNAILWRLPGSTASPRRP